MLHRAIAACLCLALICFTAIAYAESKGSYEYINQELIRPADWTKIVQESAFPLGGKEEIGTVADAPFYKMLYGSYPSIDGSTVSLPMAMEFARQHLSFPDADLENFVFFNKTHSAYINLIEKRPNLAPQVLSENAVMDEEHPVDIILVTQPSDDEIALAQEHRVTLIQEPVCYDAFVFIVHKDNPIDNLTVEQIQAIYGGEVTNFAQVGGENMPIAPYQRPANSGSQTAMEKLVMQDKPLAAAQKDYTFIGMGELVEAVGTYRPDVQSLGYTYLYYIDTLYKHDDIKAIRIDGVAPTPENLRNGAYPFTTSYYAVIREEDREAAGGQFLDWMLSEEGQRCIAQAGYVPVLAMD